MRRFSIPLPLAFLIAFSASPAAAAPPEGECPQPFASAGFAAMLVLLENPDALPLLETIDANDNGLICYQPHPSQSRAAEQLGIPIIFNVIDDVSRST